MSLCPRFKNTRVVSYIVCDSEEYFYDHVAEEMRELGLSGDPRAIIEFRDARGLGYSIPKAEEIDLLRSIARSSGILLDATYSGKAAFGFVRDSDQGRFDGLNPLFIHTGGAFGVFGLPQDLIVDNSLISEY